MSWGVALRNAVGLGLGGIPSLLNAPPYARLAFNFLSGELDSRITFTRASNATLIGSDGTLQYAPHNLLTYSEQFDNAAWGKTNVSVTSNSIAAPDGTTTGDTVIRSTGVAAFIGNPSGAGAARQYTMSIYAKAATAGNGVGIRIQGTFPNRGDVVFNLTNGTISSPAAAAGTATGASATITSAGSGWYRCTLTVTLADSLTTCVFAPCETTAPAASFEAASAVASGCYVWGAQLNVGALQPYYSTTVKNLQGYSQEFDDAAWTKSNSTVTANVTTAPDGSLTADKLSEDTATIGHYLGPATTIVGVLGQVNTFSCYAKAAERTFLQLIFTGVAPSGGNYIAGFDLSTGVAGTPTAGVTSRIVDVGNGWFRCSMTATVQTAANIGRQIRISLNSSSTPSSYTGDGTSGIYVWGAQFSDSASLDSYVYNPAAAPSNTAYYGPRLDYDPVTLGPKGLLIEEQRTNICLYSSDLNQANWAKGTTVSLTYDTTAAPDGTTTADTITVVSGADTGVYQSIACSSSTDYTFSLYVKLGTMAASDYKIAIYDNTNAAFIAVDIVPTQTPSSTAWTRVTYTFTTPATCVSVRVYCFRNNTSASTSVNVWGMQLEQGAFATSYIPTTTAAATRAADVASVTGANFSGWYNQTEGTLLAESTTVKTSGVTPIATAQTSGGSDRHQIIVFTNTTATVVGGVTQSLIGTNTAQFVRTAYAYKVNDFAACTNGGTVSTDTAGSVPTVNYATLGKFDFGGGESLNGHIRSFKYYPTRLSNGQLQTLTK